MCARKSCSPDNSPSYLVLMVGYLNWFPSQRLAYYADCGEWNQRHLTSWHGHNQAILLRQQYTTFLFLSLSLVLLVIGMFILVVDRNSILTSLFILEVIFFSVLLTLLRFPFNPLLLFFSLVVVVASGVLGLSFFMFSVNSHSQEKSRPWLE